MLVKGKERLLLSCGMLEKLRFMLIGGANTGIDFLALNLLINLAGLDILAANLVSTFLAMCFSLVMNRSFVFRVGGRLSLREVALFVFVTLTGIWGIQSAVIFLSIQAVPMPLATIARTIHSFGLTENLQVDFLINNGAKVVATVFSLVWNYVLYKYVVFATVENKT